MRAPWALVCVTGKTAKGQVGKGRVQALMGVSLSLHIQVECGRRALTGIWFMGNVSGP